MFKQSFKSQWANITIALLPRLPPTRISYATLTVIKARLLPLHSVNLSIDISYFLFPGKESAHRLKNWISRHVVLFCQQHIVRKKLVQYLSLLIVTVKLSASTQSLYPTT